MLIIRAHHQNETMKTVIVLLVSISSEGLISTQKSYHESCDSCSHSQITKAVSIPYHGQVQALAVLVPQLLTAFAFHGVVVSE